MVTELRNYIANMNTSGSMALNITKATAYLKNRRKGFERQLVPEAARTYASLLGEIRNIEKEISAPEYENQLQAYQNMRTQVRSLLAEKQEERQALLQKIASGRQVLAAAQFTSEESVIKYRNETKAIFDEYQEEKAAAEKKSRSGRCHGFFRICRCFRIVRSRLLRAWHAQSFCRPDWHPALLPVLRFSHRLRDYLICRCQPV